VESLKGSLDLLGLWSGPQAASSLPAGANLGQTVPVIAEVHMSMHPSENNMALNSHSLVLTLLSIWLLLNLGF
jgi:hypothetical protein